MYMYIYMYTLSISIYIYIYTFLHYICIYALYIYIIYMRLIPVVGSTTPCNHPARQYSAENVAGLLQVKHAGGNSSIHLVSVEDF